MRLLYLIASRTDVAFLRFGKSRVPGVIFEVTSRATAHKDLVEKPQLYAKLGVQEYFLYDPDADYLDPPLQGFRFQAGEILPIECVNGALPASCATAGSG